MSDKRVAVVTGVTSGIGQATARLLSEQGFRVFGTMRNPSGIHTGLGNTELLPLDVRDDESVRSFVQTVIQRAGRIDGLVNNAGFALFGSAEETSIEEAKAQFDTNFFGVLRMVREVLPIMRRQGSGRIVNISSVLGFLPAPYIAIYAATKHALEGYSESLDHEVRQFGIRVSLIEPGFTRTNLDLHSRVASQLLEVYADERDRARDAIRKNIVEGEDPLRVASVVLEALASRSPRLRYPAGREANRLGLLRKFAPANLMDKGLRKQFGLEAA
jgi:NAD(P)-dependent dehydrogenase (short-subunit alcohol dehydrogenase family)